MEELINHYKHAFVAGIVFTLLCKKTSDWILRKWGNNDSNS